MSSMKKGMRCYENLFAYLSMAGKTMTVEDMLDSEQIMRAGRAFVLAADLRTINAGIDLAHYGRTRGDVPQNVNSAIERMFLVRAGEILASTTEVKRLQKIDKQLDSDQKKKDGCPNHLKDMIGARVGELGRG